MNTLKNKQPHGCSFQNRNIRLDGKRTSIRLEHVMWEALEEIALHEGKTVGELCGIIAARKIGANLTAAVRLFIIIYFRLAVRSKTKPPTQRPAPAHSKMKLTYSPTMNAALATLA